MKHQNTVYRLFYLSKYVWYKLIQMKILHWTYTIPYKVDEMNPHMSDLCWHGCQKRGSIRDKNKNILGRSPKTLCFMLNMDVSLCPEVCLLGVKMDGVKSGVIQQLLILAFLSVKRVILMIWKVRKPKCFCLNHWLKDFRINNDGTCSLGPAGTAKGKSRRTMEACWRKHKCETINFVWEML